MELPELSKEEIQHLIDAKSRLEENERRLHEELELAAELQKSLLPREYPSDLPVEIIHRYMPYREVGGDFFDFIRLDTHKIGIIITDVSGHGIASAFLTAMFKSTFAHIAPKCASAAETMTALNRELCSLVRTDHYLTAFYLIIDTEHMVCEYCNAGHPKQLLLRHDGNISELTSVGFFLGMFEGTDYENRQLVLETGDTLCLFTDGIIETIDEHETLYERERVAAGLVKTAGSSLETTANHIMSDLIQFMSTPVFSDDITLLLIRMVETI
ncbi:MAG: serine/threonine-protein phosphatase [Spirochaetales bacterium]|nr:serine/threonine-protein phosphatase [Spirochaetales bacterium]